MLTCRACLLRSLRAVAKDVTPSIPASHSPFHLSVPHRRIANRRLLSTALATSSNNEYGPLAIGKQPIPTDEETDNRATSKASHTSLSSTQRKHLQLELKYLSDPFKLAEHVQTLLAKDKIDKALDLVRLASKDMAAVVSWNHIVNWYMLRNKIDDGIKIYNEMKKRAHFPDSHTYILLLRGLAKRHHHGKPVKEGNVAKAINILTSMSGPTSRVKPDIRHTNAALQVCATAADMDAMWGIFSKLPSTGGGSPDRTTYTILLDAIRYSNTSNIPQGNNLVGITRIRDRAIQEGRRVWKEVISRWRSGEIMIDAQLVCSMGRLLLASTRMEDRDDVFDLVQQTTKIDRLVPPLNHPDRRTEHVPEEPGASEPREIEAEDTEGYKEVPATMVFGPIKPYPADPAHPKRPTTLAWVAPSAHMLSLLIDVCTALRIPRTATAYWDLFTTHYGVQPDAVAFNSQLKLLAYNRNSARAAKLVNENMEAPGLELNNQTFRIAMKACARDNKNPNVFSHARVIVDKMDKTQADLDIHTLIQYLNLAMLSDDASQIVGALDRLDPIVHKLRSRLTYGTDETGISPEAHAVDREETVGLLQTMVGAIDTLMNRGLVEREQYSHWHDRRSSLNQTIGRAINSLEKQEQRRNSELANIEARRTMKENAREAGRLMRQRKYEDRGLVEPRMSKAEWALKVFRSKEKRKSRAEERLERASGIAKWRVNDAKRDIIFADSPMELSQR